MDKTLLEKSYCWTKQLYLYLQGETWANARGQENVVMGTKWMTPLVFIWLQSLPVLNQKVSYTPSVGKNPWSVLFPEMCLNAAWDSVSSRAKDGPGSVIPINSTDVHMQTFLTC